MLVALIFWEHILYIFLFLSKCFHKEIVGHNFHHFAKIKKKVISKN